MVRGKVQLKLIEDKSSRQVSFSKRRSGLMKKAKELSVLCDVEIALIIFSGSGRIYEFPNGDRLRKILDRYQVHMGDEGAVCKNADEGKKHHEEYSGLWTGTDVLQMVQSFLEKQNIGKLNMTQLTQLERQLDAILRQTKMRKTQLMMETVTMLHDKEKQMIAEKNSMENEITELINENNQQQIPVVDMELITHASNSNVPPLQRAMLSLLLRKILYRYQVHMGDEGAVCKNADKGKKHHEEYSGLWTGTDVLQMVQSFLEKQNIGKLNMTQLTQVERQLDAILRQTKMRKTQLMMETVTMLHEKEKQMIAEKNSMENEITELINENNQQQNPVVDLELITHASNSNVPPLQRAMLSLR